MHWGDNLASLSPLSKALRKTRGGTPRNNSQTESSRAPRSTPSIKTKKTISHPSLFLQAAAPRADRAGFFHTPASLSTGLAASARSLGRLVIDRWCRERERREREREKRKRRGKEFWERECRRERKTIFPTTFNEGFACSARSLLVFCTLLSEKHYFPPKSIRVRLHGRRPFRWRRRSRRRRQEARPQAPRRPWPHRRHRQRRRRHR